MKYAEQLQSLVQEAGQLVVSYFRSDLTIHRKKDKSFATNADLAVEKLLKEALLDIIPGSGFIAEESGNGSGNEYTWVIDPIDGTKNFSKGIPYFCISIALMQGQEIIAGVIYNPMAADCFIAEKGSGCFLNGQRITLQKKDWQEKGALIVISDFRARQAGVLQDLKDGLKESGVHARFRLYGAAALDMAYAATGGFDAVLFERLRWWDAAAGILLIKEAGGFVAQYDGSEVDMSFKTLLGGDSQICQMIIPKLKG